MRARLVMALLATVAVVAAVVVLGGSEDPYRLDVQLGNASGLVDGSTVAIGGVTVGRVDLELDRRDQVVGKVEIDPEHGPVGQDAKVVIGAVNLLGAKQVRIVPGDTSRPAPSGAVVPASRVSRGTDLDQVLNVLDPDTRARLAIVLNEAGMAVHGRRASLREILLNLPSTLDEAEIVIQDLGRDNRRLGHLLDSSSSFVERIAAERRNLSRLVSTVGRTATVVASRRAGLRDTLDQAPATLSEAQGLLTQLRVATRPIDTAARQIRRTAPSLEATLREATPLADTAVPTLDKARRVAPQLSTLARRSTPVLREARKPVGRLARLVEGPVPVIGDTLDKSIDNLLAVVENWSRAIQFRDGLSHVFRGEASVTPDALTSILDRLAGKAGKTEPRRRKDKAAPRPAERDPSIPAPAGKPELPKLPRLPLPELAKPVGEAVQGLLDAVDGVRQDDTLGGLLDRKPGDRSGGVPLLDFLLGP